ITKDDGLKSLSVLYKRLVDMLDKKTHLPAVLQSLGCIAQTAMPVFETRESEIEGFIKCEILKCSSKAEDNAKACWDDRSELCLLKLLAFHGLYAFYHLIVTCSSVDLILERLCLEGSRRQAKYAVHALAAITKDDGLKSLSVLYKRLVDMLDKKTHLPAVLQSLGCIAQTAMPVFETRESEIEGFIKCEILKCSSKAEDNAKACWDDRSELCLLKIFGIKTMVKSYLPVKDAHLRLGIDDLLEILKNILLFGEISKDIESSAVDKAHLRLAAAKAILRLARHWDHKIPVGVFHLTLRTSESSFPQAKKLFLSKVHQYIKDRLLDAKYACAFSFNIVGSQPSEFEEDKHNLGDIIQMYHQAKARQLSTQSDASSLVYPEFILPYLVHALAHHSCPDIDECKDVKAFEPIYWKLHIFLSMLVHGDEDTKAEAGADKEKEGISAIISIFQSIKLSEDIVDAAKSKNSHALCDLGLSIIKRLVQKQDDVQGLTSSITLPPILYKLCEKEGDDSVASEGQTWLADETVLTHFESLKLETNGMVDEEGVINNNDRDGNELPLGKMIKRLKSRGTKSRKAGVSSFQSTDMDSEVHTDSEDKVSALKNIGEPAESDLLVSCFRRNSNFLSKRKGKGSDKGDNDEARIVGEDEDHDLRKPNVPMETDKIHTASNVKSSTGSTKKRKRRSIAGLAKVSVESRGSSDVSNPEPNAMSKVEDMNSGDSEEKLNERSEKGLTGGEESDKEEKSVSEGKQVEDKEKRPSDTEESEKEEKPYSEGRPVEDKEGICQDAQESPEKKESYSEEREPEESKRDSPSGEEANKEEQSDSEETQAENLESNPTDMDKSSKKTSDPSNTEDAKNSDDEPLSMWKRRVGKPV
ncbi:unnamed protein product, partial [Vitis vinifera]